MQSQVKPHSVSIRRYGKNSDGLALNWCWRARPAHDHPCALQVLGWRLPKVSKSAWQSGGKDVRHNAKTHAMARPRVRNKDGTSDKSQSRIQVQQVCHQPGYGLCQGVHGCGGWRGCRGWRGCWSRLCLWSWHSLGLRGKCQSWLKLHTLVQAPQMPGRQSWLRLHAPLPQGWRGQGWRCRDQRCWGQHQVRGRPAPGSPQEEVAEEC